MVEAIESRPHATSAQEATTFAERLVGFYPVRQITDPKAYAAGLTAVLAAFPIDMVRRVCDPVHGLPSRLKFIPTIAEVREALDQELDRRNRILANARWVLKEAERRKRQAEEDVEFQKNRLSPEERAKQVANILASLKLQVN